MAANNGTLIDEPDLWSPDDIIAWLGISERMFRRHYMVHPDWPRALTPPRCNFRDRRWYKHEILQAVERIRRQQHTRHATGVTR